MIVELSQENYYFSRSLEEHSFYRRNTLMSTSQIQEWFNQIIEIGFMLICAQVKELNKELKQILYWSDKFLSFQDIKCTIFMIIFLYLAS